MRFKIQRIEAYWKRLGGGGGGGGAYGTRAFRRLRLTGEMEFGSDTHFSLIVTFTTCCEKDKLFH